MTEKTAPKPSAALPMLRGQRLAAGSPEPAVPNRAAPPRRRWGDLLVRPWTWVRGVPGTSRAEQRSRKGLHQIKLYLMARFRRDGLGNRARVVLVTANRSGEGSTTIATGLADVLGEDFQGAVLLVDPSPGTSRLAERLRAERLFPEQEAGASVPTGIVLGLFRARNRNFEILQTNPGAFSDVAFHECLRLSAPLYRIIVVDAGSLDEDMPYRVRGIADSTLLVVDAERTTVPILSRLRKTLEMRGFDVDGIVLNRRPSYVPLLFGGETA